jgi:hypothetical protein
MIEFPGSTYHCHILPHEENMMMRPMMLQPSDAYVALLANEPRNNTLCNTPIWNQNRQCINSALGCLLYNPTVDVEAFHFHVHCPLRNQSDGGFVELMRHLGVNDSATITNIEAELSTIETYAVFERVFTVDPNDHRSEMLMAYCGWARLLNESTCDNARFVCTIPGPMFRVAVGTETAVIWVNQINGPDFDWSYELGSCYDSNNTNG